LKKTDLINLKSKLFHGRLLPFVMVFVLMFAQIVALFAISERQKLDVYDSRANNELGQCISEFDNIFENLQRILVSARLDHEIIVALSEPKTNALEKQRAFLKLNTYKKFVPEIKNIYVFNATHGGIYSTLRPYVTFEEFPFGKTKEILLDKNNDIQSALIVDKADYFGDYYGRERVFRLIMRCDNSNYIMADVGTDVINQVFGDFQKNMSGNVYLRDSNRGILYGDGEEGQAPTELLDVELEDRKAIRTYYGKKYLVTHKKSKSMDVDIYSVIPENEMKADTFQTRTLLMINFVIISVVVLSLLLLLLFRNLRMTALENARKIEESKQIDIKESFMKKYKPVTTCLNHPTEEDIQNGKQFLKNLFPHISGFDVALVRIDFLINNDDSLSLRQKYNLIEKAEEIFGRDVNACTAYEQDDYALLLIADPGFDYVAKCNIFYHKLRQCFGDYEIGCSMYVSNKADISRLGELCKEVNALAEYKFIYNRPIFLDFTTLLQHNTECEQWIESRIAGIKANIMTPDENLNLLIENFITELRSAGAKDAKQAVHSLYFALSLCADKISQEDMNFKFDLSEYFQRVSSLKSLDEAGNLFLEIVDRLQSRRSENEGNKYTHIVKRTLKFIEENISDPALCRSMIADKIGMSKSYLSRIFKEIVGISISDLINDMRLKKVEEQLVTTNRSIKDIIADVGIVNQSYFTVTFKKKYGLSPSEYRDKKSK